MATERTMLVVGATGLVGATAVRHFSGLPGWSVAAVSRRAPAGGAGVTHLPIDLTDAAACRAGLGALRGITHVLYAALYEEPDIAAGWRSKAQEEINLRMLRNVVDNVAGRDGFRHITLLQGGKAYASHLGRVPVPARERWPRMGHDIFYWPQEDYVRGLSAGADWSFSILRPQMILGDTPGSPMNLMIALGVYAAVMRELGRPLAFPGGGSYVTACADSRLIARAAEFCATAPAAAGETFNVVNGDAVNWRDMWPSVAAHFSMEPGGDAPMRLAAEMPELAPVWRRIAERHGLAEPDMERLVGSSWQFADLTFGFGKERPFDRLLSGIKLRQAGLPDCYDTEDAVLYWLDRLQGARLLPR